MADTRIAVGITVLALFLGTAEAGEKMHVEVVETAAMVTLGPAPFITVFAKVILPDGSHASLICGDRSSDKNCAKIEPTAPEKMSPDANIHSTCPETNLRLSATPPTRPFCPRYCLRQRCCRTTTTLLDASAPSRLYLQIPVETLIQFRFPPYTAGVPCGLCFLPILSQSFLSAIPQRRSRPRIEGPFATCPNPVDLRIVTK